MNISLPTRLLYPVKFTRLKKNQHISYVLRSLFIVNYNIFSVRKSNGTSCIFSQRHFPGYFLVCGFFLLSLKKNSFNPEFYLKIDLFLDGVLDKLPWWWVGGVGGITVIAPYNRITNYRQWSTQLKQLSYSYWTCDSDLSLSCD